MTVGESVVVGGSTGGRIGGGADLCSDLFCLCFSALVVDSAAVDSGGCGFFFFSW